MRSVCRILTFLFIGCVICYSCSETKKINKAEAIVLTHKPSFDYVGQIYMTLKPCLNDTVIVKFRSDTTVTADTVFSIIGDGGDGSTKGLRTFNPYGSIEDSGSISKNYSDTIGDGGNIGYTDSEVGHIQVGLDDKEPMRVVWDTGYTKIYITKKITIHDTDLRVVRDIRKELMLSDSLDYYKKYYNIATKEVLVWKLSARQRLWYLIAAGLVVLLGIIIKLKI